MSLQWKVVTIFLLLILVVAMTIGVVLLYYISGYYNESFYNKIEAVFVTDFSTRLKADVEEHGGNAIPKMKTTINAYLGALGIDYSYRNYYILDNKGKFIDGSDMEMGKSLPMTSNIIAVLSGNSSEHINIFEDYMDYAYPLEKDGKLGYVIYIKDTKEDVRGVLNRLYTILFQTVLVAALICMVLGFLLSRTITKPIMILTANAEKISKGDFSASIHSDANDEIGILTNTFNYMSNTIKDSMDEIASEKNKAEAILTHLADGVIAFAGEGQVIHINTTAKKMLNVRKSEISFNELFGNLVKFEDFNGDGVKTQEQIIPLNGMDVRVHFAPFKMASEGEFGVVVVLQDITEQQKLENARREFVANVSHELRTPLSTIKSYTETIINTTIDDKETSLNFLDVINGETDRMTRIVKDLLTLSRLDYNKYHISKVEFSLYELTSQIVEKLRPEAKNNRLELSFNSSKNKCEIFGDIDRIEQVLKNIITNAIKYSNPNCTIKVSCNVEGKNAVVKVKDNGIGIPEEDIPRIFERFYRVDKARSREMGGTGLGLAIAKEIVEAHGGKISVKSKVGLGTEVSILFPVVKN